MKEKNKNIEKDFLSYENTNSLKGICAIFILLHHIYQNNLLFKGTIIGYILQNMGEWFVGIFFFCSGYGLIIQYLRKKEEYIKNFLRNRVLPTYVIYVFMIIVYMGLYLIMKKEISLKLILKSFLFGETIVKYGWYLQAIIIFYLMFYATFKFCKSYKLRMIALIIEWVGYCTLCKLFNLTDTWYISSLAFLLGVFVGYKKEKIEITIDNKKIYKYFIIFILLFFITFILGVKTILPEILRVISKMISNVIFVLLILCIMKISLIGKSNIAKKIGQISLEIYVSQGIWILLYHGNIIYINNQWLYMIAVFVSTISFSFMLHPLFYKINQTIRIKPETLK